MSAETRNHYVWPVGIVLGLLVVVIVNAVMITIAFDGADSVVASYNHGHR